MSDWQLPAGQEYFAGADLGNRYELLREYFALPQGDQVALQLVDADGAGSGAWKLTNRYLFGDMVLADEQLPSGGIGLTSVSSTTGNVLWPLADHLGSIRDLVDSSGVIREHVVYDSFGNRLSESDFDASGNPIASNNPAAVDHLFGYTGREWDRDVDLQYNRARWYDPVQGRWLSQDPIGFAAGGANLYRYVGNKSTTYIDPSGLDDKSPSVPGPVGSLPGIYDDLTVSQVSQLVGDRLYRVTRSPELTGGGIGVLVQGSNGNAIWFVSMLGLTPDGKTVQKGMFVFDDYTSACNQVRENYELAWLAAAGRSIRDVAAVAELGELPSAAKAIAKTAMALAARRAAMQAARRLAIRQQYIDAVKDLARIGDDLLKQGKSKE